MTFHLYIFVPKLTKKLNWLVPLFTLTTFAPQYKTEYLEESLSSFLAFNDWNVRFATFRLLFAIFHLQYRPGQANCKFQFSMLLVKNPQFWCSLAQTFSDWPHHGWVNPWKFEQNWKNVMDFSLIALKVEICN